MLQPAGSLTDGMLIRDGERELEPEVYVQTLRRKLKQVAKQPPPPPDPRDHLPDDSAVLQDRILTNLARDGERESAERLERARRLRLRTASCPAHACPTAPGLPPMHVIDRAPAQLR